MKKQFDPSCDRHTLCYLCASKKGWSQKQCDDRLYVNTMGDCAIPGEGDAVSMAISIAAAVGTFGASTAAEIARCTPFALLFSSIEKDPSMKTFPATDTNARSFDWCDIEDKCVKTIS